MHRIDSDGAVATAPTVGAAGEVSGFYSDGNSGTGQELTVWDQDAANAIQEELCGLVLVAQIALVKGTYNQVQRALRRMYGGNVSTVNASGAVTIDQAGLVLIDASAGNVTITLPIAASLAGLPCPFDFARIDTSANIVTIVGVSTETGETVTYEQIAGNNSVPVPVGAPLMLRSNGVNAWAILSGAIASDTVTGIVKLASIAEAKAGTNNTDAVTPAGLSGAIVAAGLAFVIVGDQQATGVDGGDPGAAGYTQRNWEILQDAGGLVTAGILSLTSNVLTLTAAGTYEIEISATSCANNHKLCLANNTGGAIEASGTSTNAIPLSEAPGTSPNRVYNSSTVWAVFTVTTTPIALKLMHWTDGTASGDTKGFGHNSGDGTPELYAAGKVRKAA